jgi:hypothetical protein
MSSLFDNALFGTPPTHTTEKNEEGGKNLAVKAPEFDITQYVKKLSVSLGLLAAASAAALKVLGKTTPSGLVAACLGVTAVGILGVCLISAVDIAARAYVTRGQQPNSADPPTGTDGKDNVPVGTPATPPPAIAVPSGRVLAWVEGYEQPRLVLAITGDGAESKYLLSGDTKGSRPDGTTTVASLEGRPAWHDAKEVTAVRAVKLADWPAA